MMDGRFDQHFAELFPSSVADEAKKSEGYVLWPLAAVCIWVLSRTLFLDRFVQSD